MNSRAACVMISTATACFHAGLWAGVVVRDVAIQDLTPIPVTPIPADGTTVLNTPRSAGACFIAGTLVHTDKGLVPIEKLRVGDMVLSQPEMKGEQAYKRVVNTFSFVDKDVYLLMYASQDKVDQLVATDNHPFWVSDKGWVQASDLEPGDKLELVGAICATVFCVERIFRTDTQGIGWVQGKYGRQNDFTGDLVDLSGDAIAFGEEGVPNGDLSSAKGDPRLKRLVFNIEVEDFHTYYVGEMGVWVHNTNCGGEGVKPENPNIDLRSGAQTKLYDVLDSCKLDRREGVVLVTEILREINARGLFERETDFALTNEGGVSVVFTGLYENSASGGKNAIRLDDGLQRMADGSPSMTTIDAKSGVNGSGSFYDLSVPEFVREQFKTKTLDNFRRVSEFLEQNPGRSHIIEFQTKSAFDTAVRFFSEVVAKEGYADNIMLRLRGIDYLTGESAVRGREPVVTFDRAGNATRVENPVFRKASEGPRPGLDVANEFKSPAEMAAQAQEIAQLKETCFSGDTVVHMEGGKFEKIKYVSVGDKVLSRCEITGEMAYKKVIKKFHHERSDDAMKDFEIPAVYLMCAINHPNWPKIGGLHVTPEHPIWVNGKGWTAVRDIQPGDVLGTADGAEPIVESIDTDGSTYNVYNLHVEDFHTYFVGTGFWVHNQKISELVSVKKLQEVADPPPPRVNPALAGETS